jgi:GWxTD domain-containing protein
MSKSKTYSGLVGCLLLTAISFCILSFGMRDLSAQSRGSRFISNPLGVYFHSFPSVDDGKIIIALLLQMDYDDMRFLKDGDYFTAKYDMSIEILDSDDNIVDRRYWLEEIKLKNFSQTVDTDVDFVKNVKFKVDPGYYKYIVQMTDSDSKKTYQRSGSRFFGSYWTDMVGISDVVFTSTTEIDTSLKTYIPSDNLILADYTEGFSAQFQIFSADNRPITLIWRMYDYLDESAPIHGDSVTYQPADRVVYIDVPIDGRTFQPGIYLLRTIVLNPDKIRRDKLTRFVFTWINRPLSSYNISESIEQMNYILDDDEKDLIKDMNEGELRAFFVQFWEKHDRLPETDTNEWMEEYFRRIEYANQNFSAGTKEGWKSDRGRIYCIYGKPDSRIKKTTLDPSSPPMEEWIYNKARKRFLFLDRSRAGHYLLVSETTISR